MNEQNQNENHETNETGSEFTFDNLKSTLEAHGFNQNTAEERFDHLRNMSEEGIAFFMADVNRGLQGSDETLVHDKTMKIGETPTLAPEDRYDVFNRAIEKIKLSDKINPARAGDVLALATVLIHPFKDGNGRTARMLGFMFRDDFDGPEAEASFKTLAEPWRRCKPVRSS
jgi:hypothetical protein